MMMSLLIVILQNSVKCISCGHITITYCALSTVRLFTDDA